MSTPPLFKDLGKRSSDLLTKEYPSEEKKFEWKGTTSNGITIETNAVQKGDGPIVGTITPSYKYKEYGLNVLGEFNTNKDIKLETSVENQGVQGLKATLTGEQKGKDTFATLAAEYKHQHATVNGSVDFGKSKGNTIKANSVFGHIGWLLGLSAEYLIASDHQELKLFNTTVGYTNKDFDVTVFGRIVGTEKGDKNEVGGTYFHNVREDTAFGAEVVFDTSSAESKPKLSFGGQHKLQEDTILKAKVDTTGILGFSFQQRFNKNSKMTIASKIDTGAQSGKSTTSVGFNINCTF